MSIRVLSPRLRECLILARDGLTAIQIGEAMGLSYRTVNQYLSDAYKRLGARNRAQAVSIAIQRGEIPAGPATQAAKLCPPTANGVDEGNSSPPP